MARPKAMTPEQSAALIAEAQVKQLAEKIEYIQEDKPKPQKVVVNKFQMGLPCDLLGSKFSFSQSRNLSMEATPLGIIMRSKESKRKIMVPWTNIKAAEFQWDGE